VNWLNIPIETLTSEAFLGAEPVDRATWLCLMRYCAQHETGGVIPDCGSWGDRKWMQLAGVTKAEVHRECSLWAWRDAEQQGEPIAERTAERIAELSVSFYPLEQERAAQAKREAGRRYGRGRKASQTPDDADPSPSPLPQSKTDTDKDKGNGKAQRTAERIAELSSPSQTILSLLQSTGAWNHRDHGFTALAELGRLIEARGERETLEEAQWYAEHHGDRYAPSICGIRDLDKWPKIRAAMARHAQESRLADNGLSLLDEADRLEREREAKK
jgi:hypothetical protein